jgi:hypothetical protein
MTWITSPGLSAPLTKSLWFVKTFSWRPKLRSPEKLRETSRSSPKVFAPTRFQLNLLSGQVLWVSKSGNLVIESINVRLSGERLSSQFLLSLKVVQNTWEMLTQYFKQLHCCKGAKKLISRGHLATDGKTVAPNVTKLYSRHQQKHCGSVSHPKYLYVTALNQINSTEFPVINRYFI